MDFIVKFQTWACQRLSGLWSIWSSFIHKSWKGSMHTQHMEVFFLNQVHMVALLSTAAWHAQRRESRRLRVSVLNRNDFSDSGIWWRQSSPAPQLSPEPSAHGGNYINWSAPAIPPVEKKSQKFFSQFLLSVRSPAISPSVNCPHVCEASSSSLFLPLQQWPADDYRLSRTCFKFKDRNMLAVRYICQALTFRYLCLPLLH